MVTALHRTLHRLRRQHDALGQKAVGVRVLGGEIVLFTGWNDTAGRLRTVRIRLPWLDLLETRRLAELLLGGGPLATAIEDPQPESGCVWYAVALDMPTIDVTARPRFSLPRFIRWFDSRALGAPLGQSCDGFMTVAGRSLLPTGE